MDIFMVNATPRPETLADLSRYMVDKILALFGTLKAWEDELIPQTGPQMGGTFMEDVGGFMQPEREQTHPYALFLLQKEQVLVARLPLEIKKKLHYNKQLNAAIMEELGWKEYSNDANIPDVPYMGDEGLKRTKWVHYNLSTLNPCIEGTDGPDDTIYRQDLHAMPQSPPNFDEAKGFQDGRLQIFHPTFKEQKAHRPCIEGAG
jgi:hypothetical protein